MKQKIYLAGPEVFYPNCIEIGKKLKDICMENGYIGLFPLDNEISSSLSKKEAALEIVKGNMNLIKECDFVFADLSNFRGTEKNPMCDSGTAWECGYAIGLNKKVIGYTYTKNSIPSEIAEKINLIVEIPKEETLNYVFNKLKSSYLKNIELEVEEADKVLTLDTEFEDIHDCNAAAAFELGKMCAISLECKATLKDKRTQIEKYGKVDKNGASVEDFGYPVNIMIQLNCEII